MKLSERLERGARVMRDTAQMKTQHPEWLLNEMEQSADLLDEAAALARRVEGAGIVEAISLMHYADGTGVLDFDGEASIGVGKRVALVPVEGVA